MNELEAMLGKPDWKYSEQEVPKVTVKLPDALVLVSSETTCRCGEQFVAPSKRLMLRFGESLLGIKKGTGQTEYTNLPREVRKVEEEVLTCHKCFDDASFVGTDF